MWPEGARAILHVDMDAFYASVEQRDDPSLRGKPVIVGGPKGARGVVSACSYEAREFGIHSAMPLRVAARLCPHGEFVRVRMRHYSDVSKQVFAIFERYSPSVEPLSVDEAFIDVTGCERLFGGPVEVARAIRADIRKELGLAASVGVAPSKFVAKIASDLQKPDALVVAMPGRIAEFLAPLKIERMWGVGPRGAEALHGVGIRTFGQLAQAHVSQLQPLFGVGARAFISLARGRDTRPVVTSRTARSVSHETTYMENVTDPEVLHATLVSLTDRVASRLRRYGLKARTVQVKVRYAPFRTITRRKTLPEGTWATMDLLAAVFDLFDQRTEKEAPPIRLLGVSTSSFSAQETLFPAPQAAVDEAVDKVRERFGSAAVKRASVLESGRG